MRTTHGAWIVSISALLLIVGLTALEVRVVLLILPLLVYLALGIALRPKTPVLEVERVLSRDTTHPGEVIGVTIKVQNRGPPVEFLELQDDLPQELQVVKGSTYLITRLERGQSRAFNYSVKPRTKGRFRFGPMKLRGRDLLGFFVHEDEMEVVESLMVPPIGEDVRKVDLRVWRTRPWLGQIPSHTPGPGTEFWAIRDYVSGDEMRRINWKASSRLDSLFTNEYEGERSGDFVIILDAREEAAHGSAEENALEMGVRATVSLAQKLLESRNRVGLIVMRNVLDWVYPGFGKQHLPRILEALLAARPGGVWTLGHLPWILSRFFPPKVFLIIISPILDQMAWNAIAEMKAHGLDAVVISPSMIDLEAVSMEEGERTQVALSLLRLERECNIARLRQLALVADWRPGEPLAVALKVVDPRQHRR